MNAVQQFFRYVIHGSVLFIMCTCFLGFVRNMKMFCSDFKVIEAGIFFMKTSDS